MFGDQVNLDIRKHASEVYPFESCGIVVAINSNEVKYFPARNAALDPLVSYKVHPEDQLVFHGYGEFKAIVHSHPNGPPNPSEVDMRLQMDTEIPFGIVVSKPHGTTGDLFWFGDQVPIPPLEGRQFRHGVLDCYSLCRDYFRLERDIILPDFPRSDEWWMNGKDLYEVGFKEAGFERITMEDMEVGDGMICSVMPPGYQGPRVSNHAGVCIGNNVWVHHLWSDPAGKRAKRLSRREPMAPWAQLATHFVRYVG